MSSLAVGVDVAKATLAAAFWVGGKGQTLGEFANSEAGFVELRERIEAAQLSNQASEIHLVMEPTGGYELAFAGFAYQQGWKVSLPNPKYVRDWAKGLGQRAKTDKQDALLLARFAAERQRWSMATVTCASQRTRKPAGTPTRLRTVVRARAQSARSATKPSWSCYQRCPQC
jgi:transposase